LKPFKVGKLGYYSSVAKLGGETYHRSMAPMERNAIDRESSALRIAVACMHLASSKPLHTFPVSLAFITPLSITHPYGHPSRERSTGGALRIGEISALKTLFIGSNLPPRRRGHHSTLSYTLRSLKMLARAPTQRPPRVHYEGAPSCSGLVGESRGMGLLELP